MWQKLGELIFGPARPQFKAVDWNEALGRFQAILVLASSQDQASKKQAIIQADQLLDSITKELNLSGETFGLRLKNLKSHLGRQTYSRLWQAHLKRNELVHEAGSFVQDREAAEYLGYFRDALKALRQLR